MVMLVYEIQVTIILYVWGSVFGRIIVIQILVRTERIIRDYFSELDVSLYSAGAYSYYLLYSFYLLYVKKNKRKESI